MDETACYLDSPSSYSYLPKGSKRVKAISTGNERTRLSVAFSAAADGTKLPLFSKLPRSTPLETLNYEQLKIEYKTSGSFNDDMILNYLQRIIVPYKMRRKLSKVLLIIDSAPCHQTKKIKDFCDESGLVLTFIPPRLTNLLQPADVCWFSTIKKLYKESRNNWFIYEEKSFTSHNNMRSPGYEKCLIWLVELWELFDSKLIKDSFKYCGISKHTIDENSNLLIDIIPLHSILRQMLDENQVLHNYIDTDIQLAEANDQINETRNKYSRMFVRKKWRLKKKILTSP